MRAYLVTIALGAVWLTGVPARASFCHFVDSNGTFPGSNCRKVPGGGTLSITADGAIFNDTAFGGANLTVDCPVSSTGNDGGFSTPDALWYLDNSTGAISCTARAEDASSTAVNLLNASSTGDDNGYRSMTFGALTEFARGQVHIRCTIPPRDSSGNASYIVGYYLRDDGINCVEDDLGYHTFPGSNCVRTSGGSAGITTDGAVYNDTASGGAFLGVDCPVMTMRHATALSKDTAVWYLDSSPSALSCRLSAVDPSNDAVNFRTLLSTSDDNNYHSFSFAGSTGIATFDGGYVHLSCSIPPRDSGGAASYVVGYIFDPLN